MPSPPLHLSADLDLDLSDPLVVDLRYPGSVVLEQSFGRRLGEIDVGGDLDLDVPLVTGTVRAGGIIRVRNEVDAATVHGRELHLTGGTIRARALSATQKIVIGPGHLKVDVILAPHIEIHPETTGRVTVIESRNVRGTTKIKGGFTLAEYEDLFGDAAGFLLERGVAPLAPDGEPDDEPPLVEVEVEPLDDDELIVLEPLDELDPMSDLGPMQILEELEPIDDDSDEIVHLIDEPGQAPPPSRPAPAELPGPANQDTDAEAPPPAQLSPKGTPLDDEATLVPSDDDPAPLPEVPPRPAPRREPARRVRPASPDVERWSSSVVGQVHRIARRFPDPPAPIQDLLEAADEGADAVERALIPAWQDLVQQHRKDRRPIDPGLSHAFRVLDDLVARAP